MPGLPAARAQPRRAARLCPVSLRFVPRKEQNLYLPSQFVLGLSLCFSWFCLMGQLTHSTFLLAVIKSHSFKKRLFLSRRSKARSLGLGRHRHWLLGVESQCGYCRPRKHSLVFFGCGSKEPLSFKAFSQSVTLIQQRSGSL